MKESGFSILEFLVVIAIIGVLGAMGIAGYESYYRQHYFTEILTIVGPYHAAVNTCAQQTLAVSGCDAGKNGVPAAITEPTNHIASLTVNDGVITVTPIPSFGVEASDIYVLTPMVIENGTAITWKASGPAVKKGYIK